MTKSSYGLVLLFAGCGGAAAAAPPPAGPVTADEAMRHYHETFGIGATGTAAAAACAEPERGGGDDIVVCGRTPRRVYRLPLPIERDPGEIVRHANEPDAAGALAGPACSHSCYKPVTVNPIAIILAAPKVIRHILHPGDD
jgi:hypothetical protein